VAAAQDGSPPSDQPALAFAFAAAQSDLLISTNPLPLQEFRPLQEFLADLQEDWPLQEFTPVHLILASSALAVETMKVPNSKAAAVAIATPPVFVVFIIRSLMGDPIMAPEGRRRPLKKSVPVSPDRDNAMSIAKEHRSALPAMIQLAYAQYSA
jgi:hypothetical protein